MPHRSARDALRDWREEILNRLASLELREEAEPERARLLLELDEVRRSLELLTPPRPLRMRLRLVRGCDMPWEMMTGDARVRHCGACDREVYDLRAMDPDEVEAFIAARREKLPCMRMHIRPDGRYQDGPCVPAARRRLVRATATAVGLGLAGIISLLSAETSAVDEAVRASMPVRATFDARAFVEPPPEPPPLTAFEDEGVPFVGLFEIIESPYQADLDALEERMWSEVGSVHESGYVSLLVTVDPEGRVTAEVERFPGMPERVAERAARVARGLRAPFRPDGPVTTVWARVVP